MWHRTKDLLSGFWLETGELCKNPPPPKKEMQLRRAVQWVDLLLSEYLFTVQVWQDNPVIHELLKHSRDVLKVRFCCWQNAAKCQTDWVKRSRRTRVCSFTVSSRPGVAVKGSGCCSFACFSFPRASLYYITVRVSSSSCCCLQSVTPPSLAASLGRWGVAGTKKWSHGTATVACAAFFICGVVQRYEGSSVVRGFFLMWTTETQIRVLLFCRRIWRFTAFFSNMTQVSCWAIWKLPFHVSEVI